MKESLNATHHFGFRKQKDISFETVSAALTQAVAA